MIFEKELTSDENVFILDIKFYNPALQTFQLQPGVYQITQLNKSLPPSITINNEKRE